MPLVGVFDGRWGLAPDMVAPVPELPDAVPLNSVKGLVHYLVLRDSGDSVLNLITLLLSIPVYKSFH